MSRLPLLVAFGLLASPLLAQEVKIVGPVWAGSNPAPASLPPLKGFDVRYPPHARKGSESGYTLVRETVAANGNGISRVVLGNYAIFQRAVETLHDWHIGPATRDGQPIDSDYCILVIFNPAAAMAAGPDATPRLLSATTGLIWLNADRFTPEPPPQLVNAVLHLTVRGRVAEVDVPPAFADLKENFMHALRAWSFAPARRDGQPVATTLTLPLVVQPRPIPGKAAPPSPPPPAHMPVALRQPQPVYPQEMLRSRMDGEVVVEFALDAEGSVQNPAVVRSSDHGFEAAALAAVKKWKFKPATLADGTPVPVAKMQVPLVFQRRIQGPFALP